MIDRLLEHCRRGWWAVRMTWTINRPLLCGVIGANLIQSVVPLGLALSARGIVNAVVAHTKGESATTTPLMTWLAVGLALAICEAVGRLALTYFTDRLRDEVNIRISSDIMTHADGLDLTYFEDPRFQDVFARANQRTAVHFLKFVTNALEGLRNAFQVVSLTGLLVFIDPLIVILLMPVAIPFLVLQWRLLKKTFDVEQSKTTKYRLTNYYTGLMTRYESVPEVKILGLGPWITRRFDALMREFRDKDRRLYRRSLVLNGGLAVISTIITYAVFTRVAFQVVNGGLTVGDVAIFGSAAMRLRMSIHHLVLALTRAMEQTLYISNLIAFFDIEPTAPRTGAIEPDEVEGAVRLENVSFGYPGTDRPAVEDISLHIAPGETVAVVGENGAGKTTLVRLIVGFYRPSSGRVLFDGLDVDTLSRRFLYEQISFMFQNFGRYEASAGDNIAFGNYSGLKDDPGRVREIAEVTEVSGLIESLPDGFDTALGKEFGAVSLSGGQWQQIALARAFARDARVLILDEPTSNMDIRAEARLFAFFRDLARGRTTILISHRFSTVSMADRIFVMNEGRLIEQGAHPDLMALGGHYARMYDLYARKLEGR
jgi:ATP-binding cassette subfamily B protein